MRRPGYHLAKFLLRSNLVIYLPLLIAPTRAAVSIRCTQACGGHTMELELELIATGYGLVEGPRTDANGALWFTDARGGTVNRRNPDGTIETVLSDRPSIGGLALHADGGLLMSGPNVAHLGAGGRDGNIEVLLERDGVRSFNDLHTDAAGRVYVGLVGSFSFTIIDPV